MKCILFPDSQDFLEVGLIHVLIYIFQTWYFSYRSNMTVTQGMQNIISWYLTNCRYAFKVHGTEVRFIYLNEYLKKNFSHTE